MWTVNGVNYDQAAVYAVDAVVKATTQSALLEALQSSYFTNVKVENIVAYANNKSAADLTTVATIQKTLIDATNTEEKQNETVKEIIETAVAGNQIKLNSLLKASNYDRLIDSNVAGTNGYVAKIAALTPYVAQTATQIQTEIDASNLAIAQAAVATVQGTVTRVDYNKALTQVNNLTATSQKAAKTTEEDKLVVVDKLIKLTEAQTNSAFNTALTEVSKLTGYVTSGSEIFSVNNGEYKTAIQALPVASRDTAAKISTAVAAVNVSESGKMFTTAKLAEVRAYVITNEAEVAKFDKWLKDIDARVPNATFDYSKDVKVDMLKAYLTAVKTDVTITATSTPTTGLVNAAALKTVITGANAASLTTAIGNVKTAAGGADATALYQALSATELDVKNVTEANKAAYLADKAIFATVTNTPGGSTDAADKIIIQNAINAANGTAKFNAATTATEAGNAITGIAIANGETALVDLPSVARVDLAEMLLELKPSNGFADTAALIAELGKTKAATTGTIGTNNGTSVFKVYDTVLSAINTEGKKATPATSTMVTELGKLGYETFNDLDPIAKTQVAEAIIAGWPTDGAATPAKVDYNSWSAVRTAIDTAIAGL